MRALRKNVKKMSTLMGSVVPCAAALRSTKMWVNALNVPMTPSRLRK